MAGGGQAKKAVAFGHEGSGLDSSNFLLDSELCGIFGRSPVPETDVNS